MTTFDLVERTPSTSALAEMLVNHGATPAVGGELLVLAPSSLQDARERLGALKTPSVHAVSSWVSKSLYVGGFRGPTPLLHCSTSSCPSVS